jgi:hypothetical protein
MRRLRNGIWQYEEKHGFFMENSSSRFLISYIRKEYICVSGKKVAPVQVGYESYGTLAPTRDNVSLICHYYSSTSHAAGKYSAEDKALGYWDAIIGPGRPFEYGREEPKEGTTYAFMLITLSALWEEWAKKSFDRKWAEPGRNSSDSMANEFLVDAALYKGPLEDWQPLIRTPCCT